jgi:biuret amidohydrolase
VLVFADLTPQDRSGSALLLLDLQHALCHGGDPPDSAPLARQVAERGVLPRVAAALGRARSADLPIVHVGVGIDDFGVTLNRTQRFRDFADSGMFAVGSQGAAFVPEAAPVAGEPVITKSCVDPFVGTSLAPLLGGQGVRTLLLAGVATTFVVESCARHASDLGFAVWVLEDLCAAPQPEAHAFSVEKVLPMCGRVDSATAVLDALGGPS